jgi:hypothetical protein
MTNGEDLGVPLPRVPEPKTWDGIKKWGDILDDGRKRIIRDVLARTPKEKLCPCLRQIAEEGQVEWIYCQKRYDELKANGCAEGERPSFADPRYRSDVDCAFLQLFCADRFEKCVEYIGSQRKKS